jgi:hypothetical protein
MKTAARYNAKHMERYVKYANQKIEAAPDDQAEEMVVVGRLLDRNAKLLDELFNGKPNE